MGRLSRQRPANTVRTPLPQVVADPSLGDTVAATAVEHAHRGDVAGLAQQLACVRDEEHRVFVVDRLCDATTGDLTWLTTWLAVHPDDPVLRAIHGNALVHQAWAARTSKQAGEVSPEQFEQFFALLRRAETVLTGALRDDPTNAVAWTAILTCSRGLQLERIEVDELFARCDQRLPLFLPAYLSYLQTLCAKWSGSHEQAVAFARWAGSRAPVGHLAHALVAVAHFEHTEDIDDTQRAAAIAEVRNAAEQSRLTSPDWGHDPLGVEMRNGIAAAALDLGDLDLARHLLQITGPRGDRVTKFPWAYYGDPALSFAEAGRRCGAW